MTQKIKTQNKEENTHRKSLKAVITDSLFSFAKITIAISYKKILRQNQNTKTMTKPSCFTHQTENQVKAPITPKKQLSETCSYHPIENGGIILYCLLVSF
jgi:hypothetical protein